MSNSGQDPNDKSPNSTKCDLNDKDLNSTKCDPNDKDPNSTKCDDPLVPNEPEEAPPVPNEPQGTYGCFQADEVSSLLRLRLRTRKLFLARNFIRGKRRAQNEKNGDPANLDDLASLIEMTLFINEDNYLYWKMSLPRAKACHREVSRRKTTKFNTWVKNWERQNVTIEQNDLTKKWFLSEQVTCQTEERKIKHVQIAPYFAYTKYRVIEIPEISEPQSASEDNKISPEKSGINYSEFKDKPKSEGKSDIDCVTPEKVSYSDYIGDQIKKLMGSPESCFKSPESIKFYSKSHPGSPGHSKSLSQSSGNQSQSYPNSPKHKAQSNPNNLMCITQFQPSSPTRHRAESHPGSPKHQAQLHQISPGHLSKLHPGSFGKKSKSSSCGHPSKLNPVDNKPQLKLIYDSANPSANLETNEAEARPQMDQSVSQTKNIESSSKLQAISQAASAEPKDKSQATSAELQAKSRATSAEPQAKSRATSAEPQAKSRATSAEPQAKSRATSAEPQAKSRATSAEPQAKSRATSAEPQAKSRATSAEPQAKSRATSAEPQAESQATSAEPQAESQATSAEPQAESQATSAEPQAESQATSAEPQAESQAAGIEPKVKTRVRQKSRRKSNQPKAKKTAVNEIKDRHCPDTPSSRTRSRTKNKESPTKNQNEGSPTKKMKK